MTIKERHAQIEAKSIKNCHAKLKAIGSVKDAQRSCRPCNASDSEVMKTVQEMFIQSSKKEIRQAAKENGPPFYSVQTVPTKQPKWRAWRPRYYQALFSEDCDFDMELAKMMQAGYKDWPALIKNILWSDEAVFHIGGLSTLTTFTTGQKKIPVLFQKNFRIDLRQTYDAE